MREEILRQSHLLASLRHMTESLPEAEMRANFDLFKYASILTNVSDNRHIMNFIYHMNDYATEIIRPDSRILDISCDVQNRPNTVCL